MELIVSTILNKTLLLYLADWFLLLLTVITTLTTTIIVIIANFCWFPLLLLLSICRMQMTSTVVAAATTHFDAEDAILRWKQSIIVVVTNLEIKSKLHCCSVSISNFISWRRHDTTSVSLPPMKENFNCISKENTTKNTCNMLLYLDFNQANDRNMYKFRIQYWYVTRVC